MRSVNQNHHLYVVKSVLTESIDKNSDDGAIKVCVSGEGILDKDLYFLYKGRDGLTRSDMIPLNQITYAKHVKAAAMETPLKQMAVKLDEAYLDTEDPNNPKPIVGQDYILNISFQQFYGLSPEDTYVKTIAVHVTREITNATGKTAVRAFYDAMVDELNASFSREVGADAEENPYLTFEATNDGVIITEKPQIENWRLGKWEMESLVFDVFPSTIYVDGIEVTWGKADTPDKLGVTATAPTPVPNGRRMADLEWFTFGERADYYRGMGYPNNFDFIPWVVPSQSYDALEIHFAYQGTCEDIQKSEKDITLIGSASTIETLATALKDVIPGIVTVDADGVSTEDNEETSNP